MNSLDEIVSRNYVPGVSCPNEYPPILYGMKDGEYTLEGWLTDTPDPTRLLTEKVKIKFRAMDLGMTSDEASKTGYIEEGHEHKSGMQLSKHIQKRPKRLLFLMC